MEADNNNENNENNENNNNQNDNQFLENIPAVLPPLPPHLRQALMDKIIENRPFMVDSGSEIDIIQPRKLIVDPGPAEIDILTRRFRIVTTKDGTEYLVETDQHGNHFQTIVNERVVDRYPRIH